VTAKFGVPPERIVDYLTLVGDTVDNVPGVEKCGPKTAVKWLTEYGTLDNLIANADKIGGKVGENLRRHLDFLPLGKRLVTVATDVALPLKAEELTAREDDKDALRALYERFEFRGWLNALDGEGKSAPARRFAPAGAEAVQEAPAEPGAHRGGYVCISDWNAFDAWLARISGAALTAFDTETTSLDPMLAQLVGMSFATVEGEAAYLPLAHRGPDTPAQLPLAEVLEKLKPWLESDSHLKVGQNLKYDAHVLANHGIRLGGVAHDTLLQSYVLESDKSHDMDSLAKRHL
jgi:DNA polymerase-1